MIKQWESAASRILGTRRENTYHNTPRDLTEELLKVKAWYEEFLVQNTKENKSEIKRRWDDEKGTAWKMLKLKLGWETNFPAFFGWQHAV